MGMSISRLKSAKGYLIVLVISLIAIAAGARSAIRKTRELSAYIARDHASAMTLGAVPVPADQNKQAKASMVEQLDATRQKYAVVQSVHIKATVKIDLYGASRKSGNGSYEYWAEGDRYKVQCRTDPALELD